MQGEKEQVEMIKKSVGERFRSFRIRAGFSSAQKAAEAIGVHTNSVGELERGENWLSAEMAIKSAPVFGVPWQAFFSEEVVKINPTAEEALEILAGVVKARKFESALLNQASTLLSKITEDDLPGVIGFLKTTVAKDEAIRSGLLDQPSSIKKSKVSK